MMRNPSRLMMMFMLILVMLLSCAKPVHPLTSDELLDLGEKYLLELDYEQAIVQFLAAIEIEPMNPRGYIGVATAYLQQGNVGHAVEVLQSGFAQLPDNVDFLNDAIDIYESIIMEVPQNTDAYLGLAEIYIVLGQEEKAITMLQRGLIYLPNDEKILQRYSEIVIPMYEIRQTLNQEIRASDGILLARNEYHQPVFIGSNDRVHKMNRPFELDLENVTIDDFDYLQESYDNRIGYTYGEAQDGRVGGYAQRWEESYRKNQYISFKAYGEWDGLGAHGGYDISGRVFDARTGNVLILSDVLFVDLNTVGEILANEFVDQYFDEAPNGDWHAWDSFSKTTDYDTLVDKSTLHLPFWLEDDGIHIFYEQYTFYYAYGYRELVIPYTRIDLVREEFSVKMDETVRLGEENYQVIQNLTESQLASDAMSTVKDIFQAMSGVEHKKLHTFFSNFVETGMTEFDATKYTNDELIEFAIWHIYRNNQREISYSNSNQHYMGNVSSDIVASVVDKYFGIRIMHVSVGYIDNPNYWNYGQYTYLYDEGRYFFNPADGDPLRWAQVTSLIDNNDGTYTAYFDEYASHAAPDNFYEDIDDWHLHTQYGIIKVWEKGDDSSTADYFADIVYSCSFVAKIKLYEGNVGEQYQLISLAQLANEIAENDYQQRLNSIVENGADKCFVTRQNRMIVRV